uniref:AMP-binding protein n=1 Tax=Achromobacter sp. GbtcB20 TaxID=2824765 RepID=UPI0035301A8E
AMEQDLVPEIHDAKPSMLKSSKLPELRHVIRLGSDKTPGMLNFEELLAEPAPAQLEQLARLESELQFDEAVNIQFTSGTTGSPKGATL